MVNQHADAAATLTKVEKTAAVQGGATGSQAATGDPAAGPDQPQQGSARASRWVLIALVVGYLLQVGWRLYLSRNLIVPAAHADEDGYLIAARALTGGPGGITTENAAFRRMGYPLLISPVYWFTSDAFSVYRGVLLINAVINALVFPLSYLFARRVLDLPRRTSLIGALVAATLPGVVFYSEFAMTDAVLAPIALGWLVLAHRWISTQTDRGRLIGALGSGAVAGCFYVVHVRGTMVVIAHVLLAVALVLLRRTGWRLALASVVTAGVVTQVDPVLKLLTGNSIINGGRSPKSQTIDAVTTLHGAWRVFAGADGQLWYLSVATLGIGGVGLIASVLPLLNRTALRAELADGATGARRIIITTVLATTLFIAVGSSAALPPSDLRVNYLAYPRYIHLLFPMWLLIGLLALRAESSARRLLRLGVATAGFTLLSAILVLLRALAAPNSYFLNFDAPEISFLGWRWDHIGLLRPTAIAMALFAGILVLMHRPRRGLPVALAGFAAIQLATMPFVVDRVTMPMEDTQYVADTPRLVRDGYVRPGDVVAFARRQEVFYWQFNHAREVYWNKLLVFDQDNAPVPAQATVVVAPWHPAEDVKVTHWDGREYGFHLVVVDQDHRWALWRRD
jgi:hypothetical protein